MNNQALVEHQINLIRQSVTRKITISRQASTYYHFLKPFLVFQAALPTRRMLMWPIAIDVGLCVRMMDTTASCGKTAELI